MMKASFARSALLLVAGACLAMPVSVYLNGGSELQLIDTSPNKQERIEFYSLSRWQQVVRLSHAVDDSYVRLSDTDDGRTLGTSTVFYSNGIGPVRWTDNQVDVGLAGSFDRRTGRWTQGEAAD